MRQTEEGDGQERSGGRETPIAEFYKNMETQDLERFHLNKDVQSLVEYLTSKEAARNGQVVSDLFWTTFQCNDSLVDDIHPSLGLFQNLVDIATTPAGVWFSVVCEVLRDLSPTHQHLLPDAYTMVKDILTPCITCGAMNVDIIQDYETVVAARVGGNVNVQQPASEVYERIVQWYWLLAEILYGQDTDTHPTYLSDAVCMLENAHMIACCTQDLHTAIHIARRRAQWESARGDLRLALDILHWIRSTHSRNCFCLQHTDEEVEVLSEQETVHVMYFVSIEIWIFKMYLSLLQFKMVDQQLASLHRLLQQFRERISPQ